MSGGHWKEMFNAACEGDLDLLAYHVGAGVDVNYAHPEFLATPLVACILAGQERAALYLLDHGANPHLVSEFDGLTPAQAARQTGLAPVAQRLRELGADVDAEATSALPRATWAWRCRDYGGPEVLARASQPLSAPGRHQLLVRVEATSVESSDIRIRSLRVPRGFGLICRLVFGWRRPRRPVLGSVVAGTVMAAGPGAGAWKPGQRVVATTGMAGGAHAEWVRLDTTQPIVACPPELTPEQAVALVFGGLTAQFFLARAAVRPDEHVLVVGATGSVGNALVQMARARGAEVTALCSAPNRALALELGAARALDYRQHPPGQLPPQGFDVVADTCAATSFAASLRLLRPGGRYLNIAGDLASMLARPRQGRRSISGTAPETAAALQHVLELGRAGRLKPLIDSVWAFTELPAAHARAESGLKRGCVVVQVRPDREEAGV